MVPQDRMEKVMGVEYERLGVGLTVKGMDCGVVEWVKHCTLQWFGHIMRMMNLFVETVPEGEMDGRGASGRPPVKWINRVREQKDTEPLSNPRDGC